MTEINWTLFAPIIVLQFILQIIALVNCLKTIELHGPKWIWIFIILVGGILGTVFYFILARRNI